MSTPVSPGTPAADYIGRFAPSPTGPLHFGSLVCALGSYLDAVAHGGKWLLRMEDLDPPREMPGAAERILKSLESHGLHWHGTVAWQSKRHHLYQETLDTLAAHSMTYHCHCSREQIRRAGGHRRSSCNRGADAGENSVAAVRFCCEGASESFVDLWQGSLRQTVSEDPVLKRRDGLFAYQLAVVVDDIAQGVNHVIRGADLLDCTATQIQLFRALGAAVPRFGHLPLVMNNGGQKLSKQNHAAPLDDRQASANLVQALGFLGFHCPADMDGMPPRELLAWASARWQRHQVDLRNRELHVH